MDLRLLLAAPTEDERAAVDRFLDGTTASQNGHAPAVDVQGRSMHGGHEVRDRRHLLLPVLEHVQARIGWISEGALGYLCERLTVPPADAYGVATFYGLLSMNPRPARVLHVCDDVVCRCKGAEDLIAALEERIGPEDVGLRRLRLASQSVPGPVRPGAGGDVHGGRRASDRACAGGGHRRGRPRRA